MPQSGLFKRIFELGKEFDKSNLHVYMKFGSNQVINDLSQSVHKCKLTGGGYFDGHLDYCSADKTHIQTWVRV